MALITIQDAFYFTRRISEILQEMAQQTDGSKASIQPLLFLHSRVQLALLLDDIYNSRQALLQAGLDAMKKSSLSHGDPTSSSIVIDMAREVEISRRHALEQDLAHLLEEKGIADVNVNSLSMVIKSLRQRESDVTLHRQLAREVKRMVKDSEYEDTNFALGSTPISSFLSVMSNASINNALLKKDKAMVWGSSIGWLPFYLFLASGFSQVVGIELLSTLHDVAVAVKEQISNQQKCEQLDFLCLDLLHSDLKGVNLLVLTDWCWDNDLVDKAAAKVGSELDQGAIVISYRGLSRNNNSLMMVAEVTALVSWNPTQKFFVYKKPSPRNEM